MNMFIVKKFQPICVVVVFPLHPNVNVLNMRSAVQICGSSLMRKKSLVAPCRSTKSIPSLFHQYKISCSGERGRWSDSLTL